MRATVTMLRWISPPLIALSCLVISAGNCHAQASAPEQRKYPAAQQQPLDVDRDPVPAPDEGIPPALSKPQQTIEKSSEGFILRQEVSEVLLNVTVLDSKDRLVTNLMQKDFKVFEDGVPQTIKVFRHEDLPVSLGILVDDSGSMQPKRAAVTKAALDLVRLSNPQDEAFVVNFAEQPFLDQDFTNDIAKLRLGLDHIESRGGTALYDAVSASADHMAQQARRSRQVLLIITDGEDNDSSSTLEETVRRVQDLNGPVVYAIGLLFGDTTRSEARTAKRTLQLLANQTGGVAYFPKSLDEVDAVAAEVARDIRNQYVLGYHSTNPPERGGFRAVRVEAKPQGLGHLIVRTRTGYYPTKAPLAQNSTAKK